MKVEEKEKGKGLQPFSEGRARRPFLVRAIYIHTEYPIAVVAGEYSSGKPVEILTVTIC